MVFLGRGAACQRLVPRVHEAIELLRETEVFWRGEVGGGRGSNWGEINGTSDTPAKPGDDHRWIVFLLLINSTALSIPVLPPPPAPPNWITIAPSRRPLHIVYNINYRAKVKHVFPILMGVSK